MSFLRIVAALSLALLAAACQSAGGKPSPSAVERLVAAGYKSESTADLNRDLTADDIRTTAFFTCEDESRCRGISLVLFGDDPESAESRRELEEAARQPKGRRLAAVNRVFGSAGIAQLRVADFGVIGGQPGAQAYRIDVVGRLAGEAFRMRLIVDYRSGRGRLLIVGADAKSDAIGRFGNLGMLE
jgi:hypothetical protein